jgi:hypothetical protein
VAGGWLLQFRFFWLGEWYFFCCVRFFVVRPVVELNKYIPSYQSAFAKFMVSKNKSLKNLKKKKNQKKKAGRPANSRSGTQFFLSPALRCSTPYRFLFGRLLVFRRQKFMLSR